MFEKAKELGYQILPLHHAEAILQHDMPDVVENLETTLLDLEIPVEELVRGGGGESPVVQRLRRTLGEVGWKKHNFVVQRIVDGEPKESTSHEIDHVQRFQTGVIALETEWNNKDPFYDRDLENFKRLHADGAISLGVIITRGSGLQDAMYDLVHRFADEKKIKIGRASCRERV